MKSKISHVKFSKKILTSFIGAASLSLLAHTTVAQIGSASVQGIIASHMLPQPGIEVSAKNIDNGYVFHATTQKDGSYTFKGLAPGHYQIFLQDKAGKSSETLTLKVGQSVSLDFEIDKPVTNDDKVDEVTVIGTQFKIKNTSGEIGTNVSLEQINKLPQNTRNFLAFADLAPGVQFKQGNDGSTKIKGGAQGANAINVFIDGVGQKSYVLGGGITGQDSSRGNPFPQSAIGEYKVITQNYSAEYDQLSSAAIVAVTASGTNEFHGSVFYDYTDQGMREMRPDELTDHKKVPSKQGQYGISVGGPIIQDKMHFFFAYETKDNADPKDVEPKGGKTRSDFSSEYQSQIGGISAKFQEDLYFGKLDYLISDEQKIELTAKVRKENELTNVGDINVLSRGTDKKNDETRIDLSHNWRADSWINDIHLTYENSNWRPRSHSLGNGINLSNDGKQAVINFGGGEDYQDKGQSGWGLQEDFSYLAINDHVIKVGLKYKSLELHAKEQEPFNPQYYYNMDYSLALPYEVKWGAPLAGIGDGTATANNIQLGLYVQDDWAVTNRLKVNAGIRWDYEQSDTFLDYKTPDDVLNGISGWDNIKKSDININNFISNGHNRDAFKNAWQPRVGFSYELDDTRDTFLFGGLGRSYDRNLFDYLQLESTTATFPTYDVKFITADPNHECTDPNCAVWDDKYLTKAGLAQLNGGNKAANREVFMLDNNLKTPYSDQFSFGIRGSLNSQWKAEVSLSRIVSKDGFSWVLGNRREDGSFFEGTKTNPPFSFGIPGFASALLGVNGIETKTNSLFIKLDKPKEDSLWGMSVAYTYTQSKTNREANNVFSFDFPHVDDYGFHDANDLPNHRLVITGITELPGGIDFSAKLNLQSVETYYGQDCRAGWDYCVFRTFKPNWDGFLGYKQLDFAFSKDISTGKWVQGSDLTLRLDVINVTNAVNHSGYDTWFGGADDKFNPTLGKPNNDINGSPLTLKFGATWKW